MIQSLDQTTIIAQCTPSGAGALALIRLSGANAITIASAISRLGSEKKLATFPSHTIHFGWVVEPNSGKQIDQVLFMLMRAPKTFTGENTVEITCHNNPFLIEQIIHTAIEAGARIAQEGEFSRRAFINGKIDLLQAEAINELIYASNQLSLKQSLSQLKGTFSHWIGQLEADLIKSLAFTQASFEFLDEELEFAHLIKNQLEDTLLNIGKTYQTFDQQQRIREGVRVALIGSVNAGKSSLFNALIGQQRAIVTPIAGTTRDVIEVGIYKDFGYLTLIDTAGLRATKDVIEQEGIKRSWDEAERADTILLVLDGSRCLTSQEKGIYYQLIERYQQKIILITTKADLSEKMVEELSFVGPQVKTSIQKPETIPLVHQAIQEHVIALISSLATPFLLNKRHYNLLKTVDQQICLAMTYLEDSSPTYELAVCHLQEALEVISQLSGKTISEKGMDAVFRQFCVGK